GIYCFNSKDMYAALNKISNKNAQNEYYLTDTLAVLNSMNKKVISVNLNDMVEASGINSRKQLIELEKEYLKREKYFNE
ncbi:MAG: bifunctional N-acetylglucosamine-1-phosphate uridyltransferase/glucosamine-1-phosphate acetyltransferase, partial [Candidatus Cloacimonadota bacterium]|nr:bifunctional N-acetylglucosamine-1-phosphate uridyltransferase/glucosamine-1-phosphate acetyltransferase [Candidatus Cloacimonadota bacterium]